MPPTRSIRVRPFCCLLLLLLSASRWAVAQPVSQWTFEAGPVRPIALSDDGRRLYVVNTPDSRLEIFSVTPIGLHKVDSVPVGLEPVAVAPRSSNEVWVVNHLSDSVSIVSVRPDRARVVRTLLVGDEPRDIVFAGARGERAFVTTAHRGQSSPFPRSEYGRPGIGRADLWVFDANALGRSLGGEPVTVLTLFGDKPRALAVSPDGRTVYAAIFRSGNRTTTVTNLVVCPGGAGAAPCPMPDGTAPGGLPAPNANAEGEPAPATGLIVRYDASSGEWRDELGRSWNDFVPFDLPDLDVFAIDASAPEPSLLHSYAHAGTILYAMAVNPRTGAVYVSNTEAHNEVRFEGAGELAAAVKPMGEPPSVRGNLHEARLTVIRDGIVEPRPLNPHIPRDASRMPPGVRERSIAQPTAIVVSPDGDRVYLAAFGSSRIGVFDAEALEGDAEFVPDPDEYIEVSGGGPSGLALDAARNRLYVTTRFDNAVKVIDLDCRCEVDAVRLHDREPEHVRLGRRFLYDANLSSSNGEASCGVCHVFGDVDDLAWDLGDPDRAVQDNANLPAPEGAEPPGPLHPMKGPMTTQTLRGLATHGAMHWRGDRAPGDPEAPGAERRAFEAFNAAFPALLGREEGPLPADDMKTFARFALSIAQPPNPIRRLDNGLRADEARGRSVFLDKTISDAAFTSCRGCHALDPAAGHFGTAGFATDNGSQPMKVPHLRNLYQKIGMFGIPLTDLIPDRIPYSGPQVRGFGFNHDGVADTLFNFLASRTFVLDDAEQRALEAFLLVFPTELAPIVGQQVTLRPDSEADAHERIDLLIARASARWPMPGAPDARECELVVKGWVEGRLRGWLLDASGRFLPDEAGAPAVEDGELRALASRPDHALTYTCAPPGSGTRLGLDRDEDGVLDGDERRLGEGACGRGTWPGAAMAGVFALAVRARAAQRRRGR